MKTIGIVLVLISSLSLSCFGQDHDSLSFSYWTPKSWFSGNKKLQYDNINNYKFTRDQINRLVNDINTSTVLGIYYKYDPTIHKGLVPTMKFYIRKNHGKDFDSFFLSVKDGIESVKSFVTDFTYIENPSPRVIGQRNALYASSTYTLKVQTGEVAHIRTKFVCIPLGANYLYITLIDNEEEDCTDLYQEVIDKIKINSQFN